MVKKTSEGSSASKRGKGKEKGNGKDGMELKAMKALMKLSRYRGYTEEEVAEVVEQMYPGVMTSEALHKALSATLERLRQKDMVVRRIQYSIPLSKLVKLHASPATSIHRKPRSKPSRSKPHRTVRRQHHHRKRPRPRKHRRSGSHKVHESKTRRRLAVRKTTPTMKRARRVHSRSANALRKQKATKTHRRRHSHHHKGKAAKVSAPRPKRTYLLRHRTRSYDRHAGHLANLAETPTRRSHHPRHSHRRHYRVVPHQKQRQTISHQKKQLHSLPLPVNYRGHPRRSSRIAHQLKMCYCPKAHFGDFHGKDFPQGSPKRACHVHMTNHGVEM